MNFLIQNKNDGVITLKEITDILEVRHDKAKLKVDELIKEPDFCEVSKMDTFNLNNVKVETYLLTKKHLMSIICKYYLIFRKYQIHEIKGFKMKKIIISSLLAANLFANQCTIYSNQVSTLVETEIEYLGNGLDTQFCANYEMTLSLLIATKNICRNEPKLYDSINKVFEELNQVEYKIKCKLKGF